MPIMSQTAMSPAECVTVDSGTWCVAFHQMSNSQGFKENMSPNDLSVHLSSSVSEPLWIGQETHPLICAYVAKYQEMKLILKPVSQMDSLVEFNFMYSISVLISLRHSLKIYALCLCLDDSELFISRLKAWLNLMMAFTAWLMVPLINQKSLSRFSLYSVLFLERNLTFWLHFFFYWFRSIQGLYPYNSERWS